jgi:hypothetical protein
MSFSGPMLVLIYHCWANYEIKFPAILILAIEQRMSLMRLAMAIQTGFMFYKNILKP